MEEQDLPTGEFIGLLEELQDIDKDINYGFPEQERQEDNVSKLSEATQAIQKDLLENVHIPKWLIKKCFNFGYEMGHLTLIDTNTDYWNAVRLYALLLFKFGEEKNKRLQIGINYMAKGLKIHKNALHKALQILKQGKLIKTRKEGEKLHAIKHYVTMNKVG